MASKTYFCELSQHSGPSLFYHVYTKAVKTRQIIRVSKGYDAALGLKTFDSGKIYKDAFKSLETISS